MGTTKEKIAVMQAYEDGKRIKAETFENVRLLWLKNETSEPTWDWVDYDYTIVEEPKRTPFDGSDAFNLLGQKFKLIESPIFYSICTDADDRGIYFGEQYHKFADLEELYEKWNDLLKVFEPCNKVA